MKRIVIISMLALMAALTVSCSREAGRWSVEKANEWYYSQDWPVGVNYVPGYAVNTIEWWQESTFDPSVIDWELGIAQDLGLNVVRIFLNDLVYFDDPKGFKGRLNQFLDICEKHGIKAIVTFYTNGGKIREPKLGPQPEPTPGIHNPCWVPSPGPAVLADPAQWPKQKKYVQDLLRTFKNDSRIYLWHLFNEPSWGTRNGEEILPFMREEFKWARQINPSQPLSAPFDNMNNHPRMLYPVLSFLGENVDVITFHSYNEPEMVKTQCIDKFKQYGRPVICTEWLARPAGSTVEGVLPLLKENNIGAVNFGLFKNKTQTYLNWSSKAGDPDPELWLHDLLFEDGTPYREAETALIRKLTADKTMTRQ